MLKFNQCEAFYFICNELSILSRFSFKNKKKVILKCLPKCIKIHSLNISFSHETSYRLFFVTTQDRITHFKIGHLNLIINALNLCYMHIAECTYC